MARADLPQFAQARSVQIIGYGGSPAESNTLAMNGQQNVSGVSASMFGQSTASHIITAGPQTTGPVQVELNGVWWFGPFNQSCMMPDWTFQQIASQSAAGWLIT